MIESIKFKQFFKKAPKAAEGTINNYGCFYKNNKNVNNVNEHMIYGYNKRYSAQMFTNIFYLILISTPPQNIDY